MKLYRPVLIESVEQAQSMPGATLFVGIDGARYDHRGDGRLRDHDGTDMAIDLAMGRSVKALVPIEAEEETTARMEHSGVVANLGGSVTDHKQPSRRLVTPWEEA